MATAYWAQWNKDVWLMPCGTPPGILTLQSHRRSLVTATRASVPTVPGSLGVPTVPTVRVTATMHLTTATTAVTIGLIRLD
jgi:hypothetical protein